MRDQPKSDGQSPSARKRLSDVPADLLANRLTSTLIMQKGNLNKYDQVLRRFIEDTREEAAEDRAELLAALQAVMALRDRGFTKAVAKSLGLEIHAAVSNTWIEIPYQRAREAIAKALSVPAKDGTTDRQTEPREDPDRPQPIKSKTHNHSGKGAEDVG